VIRRIVLAATLLFLMLAPFASLQADVTYAYTGLSLGPDPPNTFAPYTSADSVSGYITLSSPLAANLANMTDITGQITAFSYSDGVQTYTQASALGVEDFKVATDASGAIDAWAIEVGADSSHFILSCNRDFSLSDGCSPGNGWGIGGAADEVFFSPAVAITEGTPGSFVETPEPSGLLLLGSGLAGMGLRMRRKANRREVVSGASRPGTCS